MQLTVVSCSKNHNYGIAMECLKWSAFILDLPQFLHGVNCILKHMHLLSRTEMHSCVNQKFKKLNLLLHWLNTILYVAIDILMYLAVKSKHDNIYITCIRLSWFFQLEFLDPNKLLLDSSHLGWNHNFVGTFEQWNWFICMYIFMNQFPNTSTLAHIHLHC